MKSLILALQMVSMPLACADEAGAPADPMQEPSGLTWYQVAALLAAAENALAQFNAIKDIAKEGPCVIVGRCADYALADFPNVVNVYLYADLQSRIARIARRHDVTDAKAKDLIQKTDKSRASYYNYYTNKKWGEATGYDLCLNTASLGIDGTIHMIREFAAYKEREHERI